MSEIDNEGKIKQFTNEKLIKMFNELAQKDREIADYFLNKYGVYPVEILAETLLKISKGEIEYFPPTETENEHVSLPQRRSRNERL